MCTSMRYLAGCVSALRQYTNNLRSLLDIPEKALPPISWPTEPWQRSINQDAKKRLYLIVATCGYNSSYVYMKETGTLVSNFGLLPTSPEALGAPVAYSTGLPECDNLIHPFCDPSAPLLIKLSARKCPSLRFLPLMLNQHLSPRQSVARCERRNRRTHSSLASPHNCFRDTIFDSLCVKFHPVWTIRIKMYFQDVITESLGASQTPRVSQLS